MTQITRWDPFKEMDRMIKNMVEEWPTTQVSTFASPLVDMFEEDGKLVVHTHLGGLTEKEVEISVDRGALVIKGERNESDEQKNKRRYMHRESSTTVYRRLMLPKEADVEKVSAQLSDGILKIEIPMQEKAKPKKITIAKK